MSYLVLARKYRPATFDTVQGQEHVTKTLSNAITRNKVGHAFLFTGPRGVGKTSIARIFSRSLNCAKGPTPSPCGECPACKDIRAGNSLSVFEIDGASHNSVDNVRDLIDSFRSPPAPGYRYKVYIIDEVHMLSTAAFNALLKSLEEPPPFTVFILATTEVHKIPETVISRCQRHDFRALSIEDITAQLTKICTSEKIAIEPAAVRMLARLADGSMRDGQSLLDRMQSYSESKISAADVSKVLGIVERNVLIEMAALILKREPAPVLAALDQALSRGLDISLFLKELVSCWRELLIARVSGVTALESLGLDSETAKIMHQTVAGLGLADMQDLVQMVRQGADSALRSAYPRYALESLLVRLATREPVADLAALIERLSTAALGKNAGGGSSSGGGELRKSPAVSQAAVSAGPLSGRAIESKVMASAAPAASPSAKLSWDDFVRHADSNASKILVEHLRRLSVDGFEAGLLKAHGPDFLVDYFNKTPENTKKLLAVLEQYSARKDWRVEIHAAKHQPNGGAAEGSIHHREKVAREQYIEGRKGDIANHPSIQSLKRVFPGSEIESIKVRK